MIETIICLAVAKELVYSKIVNVAHEYGVSEGAMSYVVFNEAKKASNGDLMPCGDGDGHLTDLDGNPHRSRGIVQINQYWHPEVSDNQAYNVDFALRFLALGLAEGRGKEWTTYRAYLKKHPLIAD